MKSDHRTLARWTFVCIAPVLVFALEICGCYSGHRKDDASSGLQTIDEIKQTDRAGTVRASTSSVVTVAGNANSPLPDSKAASRSGLPQFRDIARQAGIRFSTFNDEIPNRYFLPEVMGAGIAWIDFDRDGWLDLFLVNGCVLDGPLDTNHHCQFYRNDAGQSFSEVTTESHAGIVLFGQGCAVGDYDADGFADLYVSGYGPDILLKNNGDGTFEDVTALARVSDPRWGSSSLWIDLDDDNLLDLFVTNYVDASLKDHRVCTYGKANGYCGPGTFNAQDDCVYRNLGDGTFAEIATQWGLNAENGKGLAVIAADFDLDLIPEIYVGNDMTPNFLFSKRKPTVPSSEVLYREIAAESGCAVSGMGTNEASMGVAVADFTLDGLPDIFLTHYYHMKNTLYKNLGRKLFEDDSYFSKAAATSTESLGFGIAVLDYNRDAAPDLVIATGHVLGPEQQPQKMTPQVLQNQRGVFVDVSASAGDYFRIPGIARCAAAADFDNDGDVDVAISQIGSPFVLLRNDTIVTDRPFVGLSLATRDRIPPTGGRVVCRVNGREMIFPIIAGGSYLAASDGRLLIAGWEESEGDPEIEIHWRSGRIERLDHVSKNQYNELVEGQTESVKP